MPTKRELYDARNHWAFWTPIWGAMYTVGCMNMDTKMSLSKQVGFISIGILGFGSATVLTYKSYTDQINDLN